jgi:hypothetical protein
VQGNLAAALSTLMGSTAASAATLAAIQTLVADNLGNPVTLAALIQTIITANTTTPITLTTTTQTLVVFQIPENPNQVQASPN